MMSLLLGCWRLVPLRGTGARAASPALAVSGDGGVSRGLCARRSEMAEP